MYYLAQAYCLTCPAVYWICFPSGQIWRRQDWYNQIMCILTIFSDELAYPVYLIIYPFFSWQCLLALLPSLTDAFMVLVEKKQYKAALANIRNIYVMKESTLQNLLKLWSIIPERVISLLKYKIRQIPCFHLTSHCYLSGSNFKIQVVNSTSDLQQLLKYATSRKIHLANFKKVCNLKLDLVIIQLRGKTTTGWIGPSFSEHSMYINILFQITVLLWLTQE